MAAVVAYAAWIGRTSRVNIIVSFPCLALVTLLWKEQSYRWLVYLCILSVAFGAFGLWYTIQRTLIHYMTTLSGLPEFTKVESFLLVPPVVRKLWIILREWHQKHRRPVREA
jgi:hypothetical protein